MYSISDLKNWSKLYSLSFVYKSVQFVHQCQVTSFFILHIVAI